MTRSPLDRAIRVEVITYLPTNYQHCKHCEVTWKIAGLGRSIHREQLESSLPDDLRREFERLSQWAQSVRERFGDRVAIRLVDAASIEGFFKSLVGRFSRYPAFRVGGARYVGSDFAVVEALIAGQLTGEEGP